MNQKLIILIALLGINCQSQIKFEKKVWIKNSSIDIQNNPREKMIQDVFSNHLRKKMRKTELVSILGLPYKDTIEKRLPKDIHEPDSISRLIHEDIDQYNIWFQNNSQLDSVMYYPIGWSISDPKFLIVKLDFRERVVDYWIEEH